MSDPVLRTRLAYIRTFSTVQSGPQEPEHIILFLSRYVCQLNRSSSNSKTPRHQFHFTAFTETDALLLEQVIENFPLPPRVQINPYFLRDVAMSDIAVHTSIAHAASSSGRSLLTKCQNHGFTTLVHGANNTDCDEDLLQDCDYVVDFHLSPFESYTWFLNHAKSGICEDNMLTNPRYNVSKHDISKEGLAGRIGFSVWSNTSGCFHGNYPWHCEGCGGKCKRGRCKVNPRPEREVPVWGRLPEKGSAEWMELTAAEVCRRYSMQNSRMTPGKYTCLKDDWASIDTFSGD